jgi:hypothetical protein
VALVCSGADRVKRGFETYVRDLFELLRGEPEFEVTLLKGSGDRRPGERVVFNWHRDSVPTRLLCRVVGRCWRYYIEFATFAAGLLPTLLRDRFDVFYVLEAPLYKFLFRWRRRVGARTKLAHFTGGQLGDVPATPNDFLHHVTPVAGSCRKTSFSYRTLWTRNGCDRLRTLLKCDASWACRPVRQWCCQSGT